MTISTAVSNLSNAVSNTADNQQQNHLFSASKTIGRESYGFGTSTTHNATSKHIYVEDLPRLFAQDWEVYITVVMPVSLAQGHVTIAN